MSIRVTFLILLISCSGAGAVEVTNSMAVSIGRSIQWPVERSEAVTVSNGAVVRVVDQGATLKITGVKLGHALVKTRRRSLEVAVLPEAAYRSYERLAGVIEGRRGLTIDVRSGSLEVRGRLLRASDWSALASEMRTSSESTYRFAAAIDDGVKSEVLAMLRASLARASLPEPDFRFEPNATAVVPSRPKDLEARFSKVLSAFGIQVESSPDVVDLAPMVRVKIIVAEFRKSQMSQIGLTWATEATGQLLPTPRFPNDESLSVTLNALESRGLGKVLASPTLLCRSGKEAEFLAGGEFPIKISNRKSHDVIWKKHGVLLRIRPEADYAGRMSIALTTEVSAIDSSSSVDGVPGLHTNRIETHFDLSSTRTIALSGLITKEWGESISGLPGLSRLPVLGPLFSSRDFKERESELVIFVTPELQRHESVN